jgi:hypothetical protein
MRSRVFIATIGYVLVGLMVCGLVLVVLAAHRSGQPFYGENAYGLDVGTYATGAVLLIAACIGVVRLVQRARSKILARRERRSEREGA